jgi:hypothetical protein
MAGTAVQTIFDFEWWSVDAQQFEGMAVSDFQVRSFVVWKMIVC